MKNGIHLPGLNGIRGIAALAVVLSHIGLALDQFGLTKKEDINLAGFGVTIFFSLSGFLITYLLLIEKDRFKNISIKQFYVRRILRIWPLYYFYLLLCVITIYIYSLDDLPGSLGYYLFFGANIPFVIGTSFNLLAHFWSLGVEEQFYLFWPWVVEKSTKLFNWVLVFICFFLLVKAGAWIYGQKTGDNIPLMAVSVTRFHCMAIGALGAILFYRRHSLFLRVTCSLVAQLIAWGVVVLMAINKFHVASLIDSEIVAFVAVVLIVNVSGNKSSILKLRGAIPDYLGKISYGLYVYHPLIIFLAGKWMGSSLSTLAPGFRIVIIYIMLVLLTIVVAGLSYEYFEKRFLVLKDRFSRVHSTANERA